MRCAACNEDITNKPRQLSALHGANHWLCDICFKLEAFVVRNGNRRSQQNLLSKYTPNRGK